MIWTRIAVCSLCAARAWRQALTSTYSASANLFPIRVRQRWVVNAVLAVASMQQSPTSAETIVYRFSPGAPAFKYVSGDLPCEVEAILQGSVSLVKNDNSDEAVLEFGNVTIHSAQTLLFGAPYVYPEGHYCREFAESLEGATLSIVMPGVDAPLIGTRATPTQFTFGPSLTDEQDFMRQFVLEESELNLNGSLIFYGDDGPSYFINASLSVVPEPTFGAMLAVLAAITISMGRGRL